MKFKKIKSLIEYTSWLLKEFHEHQNIQPNIYRIVEIKKLSFDNYLLIIQVIGKSTIIKYTPQEIVVDDKILEGFSKKEIKMITFLACQKNKEPKFKIIMQEFSENFNKILFKIKNEDGNEIISKTAAQLISDKEILNNLSKEDANCINFAAGYEQSNYN